MISRNKETRLGNQEKTFGAGLKPGDIKGYKKLDPKSKRLARARATKLLQLMQVGQTHLQTSILPPYLILELWNNEVFYKDRNNFKLVTETSFDGGTNFYVENKS